MLGEQVEEDVRDLFDAVCAEAASPTTSMRSYTLEAPTRTESEASCARGATSSSASSSGSASALGSTGTSTGSAPERAAFSDATIGSSASAGTGSVAPGMPRLMPSQATSNRSMRSLRTFSRPSRRSPSRSSITCATPTTESRPSIFAEPLTVCASRNSAETWSRALGCDSSESSPDVSDARRSSTSARNVATSSGSFPQSFMPLRSFLEDHDA